VRGQNRWDLYWDGDGYLRQIADALEPGETLRASEISRRSGVAYSNVYSTLYWMERRGMVQRVSVEELLPPKPDIWNYWPESRQRRWRREQLGMRYPPQNLWRYVGVLPVHPDTLLNAASAELEASP
jgi:hypothetical protein